MKYELTQETISVFDRTLYRIRYLETNDLTVMKITES